MGNHTESFARDDQCRIALAILAASAFGNVVSLSQAPTHDGSSRYDRLFCVPRGVGSIWFVGDV